MKRHQSVFNDNRKQRKDMGKEEYRVNKWFQQQVKRKKDRFNLNDSSEEEDHFTHDGKLLSATQTGYTDVPKGLMEEIEDEEEAQFAEISDKGRYSEMIEKSKIAKEKKVKINYGKNTQKTQIKN